MDITAIILLIIGIAVGFALGWVLKKNNGSDQNSTNDSENLKGEIGNLNGRLESAIEKFKEQKEHIELLSQQKEELIALNSQLQTDNNNLNEKLKEHKLEVEQLQKKFTTEFENIANKLLKQNTTDFAEANQKRLGEILNPLKENIKNFEQKVEDKYVKEVKERATLIEQIKSLEKLNLQMSEDAHNLTKALKGDNKAQGNWGELILEKILESSGLINGEEYETQHSTTNDEGSRIQPDVLIKLPDDKHIIVDSKVSLNAYQEYINADDKIDQENHLKNHLISVKAHIKGLSDKHYTTGKGIDSPDFVLLFMPIESSFGIAMQTDNQLYQYAWDKKVVIVTPSTLLATLKTIKSVWNNEKQTKNALEIAEQGGRLYDKFIGFLEDLEKIQKGLSSSQNAYNDAVNKLKTGSGNLIGRAEKIRTLGAKTKKQLPTDFIPENDKQLEE